MVGSTGTGEAASDEIGTWATDHHLDVSGVQQLTHLDNLCHHTGHGPGDAQTTDRVMHVPSISRDCGAEEDKNATGDAKRYDSEKALEVSHDHVGTYPEGTRSCSANECWMEMSVSENSRLWPPVRLRTASSNLAVRSVPRNVTPAT